MAVSAKLKTLNDERAQRAKVIEARALLQQARATIQEINVQIQTIADSGSFDTIDDEIKQALLAGWDVIKVADTGFESSAELLDWSP